MNRFKVCVLFLCMFALLGLSVARADAKMDDQASGAVKMLWDQYKAKDAKGFSAGLSDDAMEVAPNGMVMTKAQILEEMSGGTVNEFSLTDMKVQWIDKDCALVHYSATVKGTMKDGNPYPAGAVHCTTVLVNTGGKWIAKFHQETPIMMMDMKH